LARVLVIHFVLVQNDRHILRRRRLRRSTVRFVRFGLHTAFVVVVLIITAVCHPRRPVRVIGVLCLDLVIHFANEVAEFVIIVHLQLQINCEPIEIKSNKKKRRNTATTFKLNSLCATERTYHALSFYTSDDIAVVNSVEFLLTDCALNGGEI
jgi:hypothetical protein